MGLAECCSCRLVGAVISGALLGAALSFVVNCTLVEISLNPFFSFYFGILFLASARAECPCSCGSALRFAISQCARSKTNYPSQKVVGFAIAYRINGHAQLARRALLFSFSTLVLVAGGLCLFFDPEWIFTLSSSVKMPLYGLIGLATCFAITFSAVDVRLDFPPRRVAPV